MTDGSKDIPIKTTLLTSGWNIPTSGDFAYKLNYSSVGTSTATGTIKISTTAKPGCDEWEDYMMAGYVRLATDPAESDNRAGFILRYQDSDNYYFVGFKVDTSDGGGKSSYEVWKKVSGSYTRIPNQYDTGNNNESSGIYGLPDDVGTNGVLSPTSTYHLRVELYGIVCRVYLQNVLIYENSTDFTDFSKGEIGLEAYTVSPADIICYFDDIKVVY